MMKYLTVGIRLAIFLNSHYLGTVNPIKLHRLVTFTFVR